MHLDTLCVKLCDGEGLCEVHYYLGSDIRGDENKIQIFLHGLHPGFPHHLGGGVKPVQSPSTPICPIFVGIVVNILVIVLWRCGTYLGVSIDGELSIYCCNGVCLFP